LNRLTNGQDFDMRAAIAASLAQCPYPLRQSVLGAAYLLAPHRLPGLLPLIGVTLRDMLAPASYMPDPERALARPDGLCGLARDLTVSKLLEGYGRGMFVMSHVGPLKWWAPRQRMVLFFDQTRVEKTTRRLLRNKRFRVTFDAAFVGVVRACAMPRPGATPLTWITPTIERLFTEAFEQGHAHSFEVWENEALVGGGFGLAVGGVFITESQFHTARDASKVGFAVLNRHLQAWGFAVNDGQNPTHYLAACGMQPIARAQFSALCRVYSARPGRTGTWKVDESMLDDRWEPVDSPGLRMTDVLPGGSQSSLSLERL
jgi:leucyl/phenylalanyl-tRNA--protein transferase